MEPYLKNLSDITYVSELTQHPETIYYATALLGAELIRVNNLLTLCVRKLCAH